ncbi:Peptidyl-prolyl isomerase cwc27 [Puttea exsequens]|nr:Peptidyl-prolyl isomerase cwc27 [Puttea exsequens]
MSAVYNLEPQPTAKVLLTTTSGDIELELFAKQTPLAARNFLQHCLDGYYNGTIFHRLVPEFIIQGGDPTGTGHGGESVYPDGPFEDEFHSRLKFNRRGLLGMANAGKNDNGSQFFLTLGETRELQDKHSMFGRVVGDTIYNLMKMGEAELEGRESERPVYPTKITGAEVLVNPFEDMIKSEGKKRVGIVEKVGGKKKTMKKGGKTLLSFGGEYGEETVVPVLRKEKFNPKLVSANDQTATPKGSNGLQIVASKASGKADHKSADQSIRRKSSHSRSPRPMIKANPETQLPLSKDEEPSRSPSSSPEPKQIGKISTLLDRTNAQIAEMKASMKRDVTLAPSKEHRKKSALEQMIPETSIRGRKRKQNGDIPVDKQSVDILKAFKAKLESAPLETRLAKSPVRDGLAESERPKGHGQGGATGDDEDEAALCDLHFIANCESCRSWDKRMGTEADAHDGDNESWMSHALSFEKDRLGKDLTWKKKNEEELVVIDPREKEKSIREEHRAKKMAKLGGSTAWDRDRDRGRAPEKTAG